MSVYEQYREELEQYEERYGLPRGRLALTMDLLTDALVLAGQHAVYCRAQEGAARAPRDLQLISDAVASAKELVQSALQALGPGHS